MQKTYALEPGVLTTFRNFIWLRVALILIGIPFTIDNNLETALFSFRLSPFALVVPLDALLLLAYLYIDRLRRWLGRYYLPLGIFIATVGPIVERVVTGTFPTRATMANALISSWQLLPLLFIPLFITAWQYQFRNVVFFCLTSAALDLASTWMVVQTQDPEILRPILNLTLSRTLLFMMLGYLVVNLMNTQRKQRQSLTQANAHLAHYAMTMEQLATSRERNRLARELHDVLAHTLSGVAVELEAVKALWYQDPQQAQAMLDRSLVSIRNGLTETRRALQALRATPLEDLGLALAVRSLAESIASRGGLALDLRIAESLGDYPPAVEQTVYRVAEEALTNTLNHAGARQLVVRLGREGSALRLHVADNGVGFDPQAVGSDQKYGIKGMRERSEMIGGELFVDSRPGAGTAITFSWPGETS
ncbi:MAG: sensor histidine kinase [Anaerolineaceae bacterium]|nr:sensor histidine kinase [Anaerolineaceae bacterium]